VSPIYTSSIVDLARPGISRRRDGRGGVATDIASHSAVRLDLSAGIRWDLDRARPVTAIESSTTYQNQTKNSVRTIQCNHRDRTYCETVGVMSLNKVVIVRISCSNGEVKEVRGTKKCLHCDINWLTICSSPGTLLELVLISEIASTFMVDQ
jgi:hypothetical protein